MKVLLIGGGGREHALAWAFVRSPLCSKLYCAPGNAGISGLAECVPIESDDLPGIVSFAVETGIDFVVVGPEAPLVAGLVDRLTAVGIKAFGPDARAAVIEGSKGFMKDLCARHGVPTAAFRRFDEPDAAKEFILRHGAPVVVKADGLAAGKGVILCHNENEAFAAVDHIMCEGAFGAAGDEVIVEEFLSGEEASFFALVDGEHVIPFSSAQDHKAAFDGDKGPNTGGMGAYAPAPVMTRAMIERVMDTIIYPLVRGMALERRPYRGVLFAGLMITERGPLLLEINCRFGDPECQAIVPRLKTDLLAALLACTEGRLSEMPIEWHDTAALVVVMASQGYPGYHAKGSVIRGLDRAGEENGVLIFHAGTDLDNGMVVANGGRVLGVTATGATVADAQRRAYAAVDRIDWPEGFCRRDIGWRAVGRS